MNFAKVRGFVIGFVSIPMWIFLLESFTALALLLLIVWWTLPRSKKKDDKPKPTKTHE